MKIKHSVGTNELKKELIHLMCVSTKAVLSLCKIDDELNAFSRRLELFTRAQEALNQES